MRVDVWDTYVTKEDVEVMHFDIIVPSGTDEQKFMGLVMNIKNKRSKRQNRY